MTQQQTTTTTAGNRSTTTTNTTAIATGGSGALWSGYETPGMRDAKCSLLLQEEAMHDAKITNLPQQRILVYQDRGYLQSTTSTTNPAAQETTVEKNTQAQPQQQTNPAAPEHYYVDFKGATVLQLEPTMMNWGTTTSTKNTNTTDSSSSSSGIMPITITIGGRCVFTPENYQDFRIMMRTKEQSREMCIEPNGTFDWPDVNSLLLCPCCGIQHPIPTSGDQLEHEYWMVFYPLLQITLVTQTTTTGGDGGGSSSLSSQQQQQQQQQQPQMTLGTRTICRLTCLECMDDMLEGLTLNVVPGGKRKSTTTTTTATETTTNATTSTSSGKTTTLAFALPAADVLAEAGSASFLEDGPPRPESHPHVDDILDAWTLYNLWEQSGAWEALQNSYRNMLAQSMSNSTGTTASEHHPELNQPATEVGYLKHRMGRPCGNRACTKVHGKIQDGEMCRLHTKCRDCHSEYYCSSQCRDNAKIDHNPICLERQNERNERREKKTRKVQCDTCARKFPYTKMKKCSSCRTATYCSVDCQRMDWQRHKYHCK